MPEVVETEIQEISNLLKIFSQATGLNTFLISEDGLTLVQSLPDCEYCLLIRNADINRKKCRGNEIYGKGINTCPSGLVTACTNKTIIEGKTYYAKCGQVAVNPLKEEDVIKLAKELKIDADSLIRASKNIPIKTETSINAAINLFNCYSAFTNNSNKALVNLNNDLQNVLNTIPCGVSRFILKNGSLKGNLFTKKMLANLGYEENEYKELMLNGFEKLVFFRDKDKFLEIIYEAATEGRTKNFNIRVKKKDGSFIWVNIILRVVSYIGTDPIFYIVSTDITENYESRKKRADLSDGKSLVVDCETFELYYANEKALQQAKIKDYLGKNCYEVFYGVDKPCTNCWFSKELSPLKSQVLNVEIDGVPTQKRNRKSDWLGRPCFIETLKDITKEYESMKQLKMEQERYRIIVESAGMTICDFDNVSKRVYTSLSFDDYAISKLDRKDIIKLEEVEKFVDQRDFSKIKNMYESCVVYKKKMAGCKIRLEMTNSIYQWTDFNYYATFDEKEELKRIIFTLKDINQEEQQYYKREVDKNRALEKALKIANDATKAKSDFMARMSHDMRTPLNGVLGLTDLISSNLDDRVNVRYYLQEIKENGDYLLMLINDILNMREIERGDVELKEEVVDINLAISKIINIIKIDANKKDINLTINIKKSPIEFVYMDELRASQIVLNICNNAVQFTPRKGKIEISFIATGVKDNKTYYTIIVEDNGIGMSKDFLDKLFKPFSKETNQEIIGTGTGIGLSIVKRLVDLMEGTINVESEKGKGSKFTVKLAFEICNDKKPMPAIKNNYQLKGQRILICEDNDINALILKKLLESKGMIVDSASNGLMGLQKAKKNNYAAILMDIRMPIMDGLEAAKKIRKFDNKIPIIALSANAFDEDIRKSYKAGMNAHLSKPIEKDKLFDSIGKLILKKQ